MMKPFLSKNLRIWWVVVIVGLLSIGCAQFVIKEEDQGSVIIGKVMYRTVFAIFTLGYSEVKIHEATEEFEREQKLRAFEARVMEFKNNGEITEAQAQEMIQKERARIWSEVPKEE